MSNPDFLAQLQEAAKADSPEESYETVESSDFLPVVQFDDVNPIIGYFVGTETVQAKGKERTLHTLQFDSEDEETRFQVWGAAILDGRLKDLEPGVKVRLTRGSKEKTSNGNTAWQFTVDVAKGAIAPGS